jgi:ATP-dependent DNA helicase RecQ
VSSLASAYEALHRHFGFTEFREGQAEVIESVLAGNDTVAVMPTGGGKSLCYQLPALMMDGVTIVVSPLIALMKDQVDQLQARGLATTYINSSLSYGETNKRLSEMRRGLYKLVYVAPERFRSRVFTDSVNHVGVKLFAVDEAHCISHWGHDFRPDYLRLNDAALALGRPRIVALTATATPHVRRDISQQLGLEKPLFFVAGFDRPNLAIRVVHTSTESDKIEALRGILNNSSGAGIVYAATRKSVEQITSKLKMAGLSAEAYHAGMTEAERTRTQELFMRGKTRAIVATNAFGMGIDKRDIRFVVHYHLPGSIEAYYQEVGRAGRDGLPSECTLFFNYADTRTHQFFIEGNHPPPELLSQVYYELFSYGAERLELSAHEIAQGLGIKNEMSIQSALSVLEKAGHLERGRSGNSTLIVWLRMRLESALDATPDESTEAAVLRELIFNRDLNEHEQIEIDVGLVAGSVGLKDWQLRRALDQLALQGVVAYRKAYQGRGIRLLDEMPAASLRISTRELAARAAAEQGKLRRMIDFCYEKGCLRRFVLKYFGDQKQINRCGTCSSCAPQSIQLSTTSKGSSRARRVAAGTLKVGRDRAPARGPTSLDQFIIDNAPAGEALRRELRRRAEVNRAMREPLADRDSRSPKEGRILSDAETLVVRKALSCVARMNGRFGKGTVAAVLHGSRAKQVVENRLDRLSTYGLLKNLSKDEITAYIRALIEAGCITVSSGQYPTISLSELGREVMHDRARVPLDL